MAHAARDKSPAPPEMHVPIREAKATRPRAKRSWLYTKIVALAAVVFFAPFITCYLNVEECEMDIINRVIAPSIQVQSNGSWISWNGTAATLPGNAVALPWLACTGFMIQKLSNKVNAYAFSSMNDLTVEISQPNATRVHRKSSWEKYLEQIKMPVTCPYSPMQCIPEFDPPLEDRLRDFVPFHTISKYLFGDYSCVIEHAAAIVDGKQNIKDWVSTEDPSEPGSIVRVSIKILCVLAARFIFYGFALMMLVLVSTRVIALCISLFSHLFLR